MADEHLRKLERRFKESPGDEDARWRFFAAVGRIYPEHIDDAINTLPINIVERIADLAHDRLVEEGSYYIPHYDPLYLRAGEVSDHPICIVREGNFHCRKIISNITKPGLITVSLTDRARDQILINETDLALISGKPLVHKFFATSIVLFRVTNISMQQYPIAVQLGLAGSLKRFEGCY